VADQEAGGNSQHLAGLFRKFIEVCLAVDKFLREYLGNHAIKRAVACGLLKNFLRNIFCARASGEQQGWTIIQIQ